MYILNPLISIILATVISFFLHILLSAQLAQPVALAISLFVSASLAVLLVNLLKRLSRAKSSRQQHPARPIEGPKRQGSIKWFNTKKQYGFITSEDGDDIFVHKRFITGDKRQRIREGMQVEFSVSETDKGLQAEDVNILN